MVCLASNLKTLYSWGFRSSQPVHFSCRLPAIYPYPSQIFAKVNLTPNVGKLKFYVGIFLPKFNRVNNFLAKSNFSKIAKNLFHLSVLFSKVFSFMKHQKVTNSIKSPQSSYIFYRRTTKT